MCAFLEIRISVSAYMYVHVLYMYIQTQLSLTIHIGITQLVHTCTVPLCELFIRVQSTPRTHPDSLLEQPRMLASGLAPDHVHVYSNCTCTCICVWPYIHIGGLGELSHCRNSGALTPRRLQGPRKHEHVHQRYQMRCGDITRYLLTQ